MPQQASDPFLDALAAVRSTPALFNTPADRRRELAVAEARYASDPRLTSELGPNTYGVSPIIDAATDPFLNALSLVRSAPRATSGSVEIASPSWEEQAVRTGLRIGGTVVGGLVGGLVSTPTIVGVPAGVLAGGAVGAGAGEYGAEWLESQPGPGQVRTKINPYQVATQTVLGAIPVPGASAEARVLRAAIGHAGKGAALGATADIATHLAEGQSPTAESIARGAAYGGVFGGALGGGAQYLRGRRVPPTEYAPREPLALPPAPPSVADEGGVYPRGRRRFVAPESGPATSEHVAPSDPFVSALNEVRQAPSAESSFVKSVPAAVVEREFQGRKLVPTQYSGDVSATDAPLVTLTPELEHALRWIREDMASLPFVKHTFNEIPRGRGGDLEIVPGAAGAPIYQAIIGGGTVSKASRSDVVRAIDNLFAGKLTPTGDLVLGIAKRLANGEERLRRMMVLPPNAGDVPVAVRVRRLEGLSPETTAVQERAASQVEQQLEPLVTSYQQRFGNVVSADNFKELFPDYAASPAARTKLDVAVHRPASAGAQAVFEHMLLEPTPEGRDPLVVFTAGGTGAGKTTGVDQVFPGLRDTAKIVYDSTLSDLDGAVRNITAARNTGHEVMVVFNDRDVLDAFRGTLARASDTGRPVTIHTHVQTHLRSPQVFRQLIERFGQDDGTNFFVIENAPTGRTLTPLAEWQPRGYNEASVRQQLSQVLDTERQGGRVSEDLWQAVRGEIRGPAEGGTSAAGGRRAASGEPNPSGEQVHPLNGDTSFSSESGFINPMLAARLGLGTAGATYGAITGEDTTDRAKRAALFGAAGLAAPSVFRSRATGTVTAQAARNIPRRGTASAIAFTERAPIPSAGEIPRSRLFEFPSLQKQPESVRDEIAGLLERHGGFAAQRRGVQSIDRTHALAQRIEVPLRQVRQGTTLNAEELAAYRDALASVMTKRVPLVERIRSGAATDVERLQFSRLTDEATVLVANFRGAKAEAGRALNILRQKARVLDYGDAALIEQAIRAPGFDGDLRGLMDALAAAGDDPVRQLEVFRQRAGGTAFQKAQAAYYNGLLSGVKTHLRNAIGNSFNALANLMTPVGAAPIDVVRARVTGTPREVYLRELPEGVVATFTAMPQAFRDFTYTIRNGFTPAAVEKAASGVFDAPRVEVPGGLATNWPSRLLEASDVFFRSLARDQELMMGAYALARRARPSGVTFRMADALTGPESSALRQRAEAFAARAVFQEDPGAFINHILRIKSDPNVPVAIRAAATFVTPFIRTPANILRQGLEFSPAGFAMPAAKQSGREGVQALGRAALGSMVLAPIAYLAATGQLSGNGPSDPGERTALLESGWQSNSVKIGDRWYRYQLFQPLSVGMAAVANAWERFNESSRSDRSADQAIGEALTGAAASFLDQSFLAGLNGLLDAVTDPERNAQRFLATFAQGLVPGSGLLRNITQATDPVVRKPEGISESVKTIVPGLSTSVPARQTRFGEDVERQGGALRRGFIVPEVSKEQRDPVADTLSRLGIAPQVPRARLMRNGQTVALTRDQEQTIVKAIGQTRRARLRALLPRLGNMPEEAQRATVEGVLADVTREVNQRALARLRTNAPLTVNELTASLAP